MNLPNQSPKSFLIIPACNAMSARMIRVSVSGGRSIAGRPNNPANKKAPGDITQGLFGFIVLVIGKENVQ